MLLALLVSGCAAGNATPDGGVWGIVIGRAVVESCTKLPVDGGRAEVCQRLRGGALSDNATATAGSVAEGAAKGLKGF